MNPQAIVEAETEKFLDRQFAPLDLSGFPALNDQPMEKFEEQDKHGLNRVDTAGYGAGSGALKQGIEQLANDPEVQQQLASENPAAAEALRNVQDERAEAESRAFMRKNRDYIRGEGNLDALSIILAHNFLGWTEQECDNREPAVAQEELIARGHWTAENLELAWDSLRRSGLAELRPGQVKTLSEAEQLEVIRMGQDGFNRRDANIVLQAVLRYCQYAIGLDADEIAAEFNGPQYRPVIDKAQVFVFENCNPEYTPTRERRAFIKNFVAARPITIPMLFQAWRDCQKEEQRGFSSVLLQSATAEQRQPSLDELDDRQVDQLYHNTLKHIARTGASV
jgi:hypothetical protein